MDCALLEKLSANLVLYMLVTDDAKKLANYQHAYHNLQMKLSERKNPNLARQTTSPRFESRHHAALAFAAEVEKKRNKE